MARIKESKGLESIEAHRERQLLAEIEELRARLEEADATLCAIRGGEVDAFVVTGPGGDSVYTLGMSELLHQLHLITEALPVLISYVDQEGRLQFTNHQYEVWFRRSDFKGRHLREIFGEAGYEALQEQAEAALDGRKAMVCAWMTIDPVGERCLQATFVPHVHQGEVQGFVSLIEDITERRRAEEALRESEERYRLVARATNDVIWEWNLVTRARLWNEAVEVVFGDSPNGRPPEFPEWLDRVHPEDRERVSERLLDVIGGRLPSFEEEYRFLRGDGAWIVVHDRGFLHCNEQGEPVRMIGSMVDITSRKQTETELRRAKELAETANRAKDKFLATLSHELRTPLTPVLAVASLWERDRRLPADVQQGLAVIRRNVELEARLIDDLLDLTRIARGKLDLQLRETRLDEIVAAALETCNSQEIREKGLRIDADLLKMGYRLQADPARLTQVFWNLLRNAIKFSTPGGAIEVKAEERDGQLRVGITDNGIGIEPELLEQIFNAFDQGRPETTREYGGLGLGLAISRTIVELHGGRLLADSAGTGRGATFTVVLPLPDGAAPRLEAPEAEAPAPVAAPRGAGRGLRILLVEDHPDTAEAMGLLLAGVGHEVQVANTAAEALRKTQEAAERSGHPPFDLVVSDLGLPDISGLDLMQELAERYHLKGLALSGYGMEEDVKRSLEAGFRRHLTKPVTPEMLIQVVRDLGEELGG